MLVSDKDSATKAAKDTILFIKLNWITQLQIEIFRKLVILPNIYKKTPRFILCIGTTLRRQRKFHDRGRLVERHAMDSPNSTNGAVWWKNTLWMPKFHGRGRLVAGGGLRHEVRGSGLRLRRYASLGKGP